MCCFFTYSSAHKLAHHNLKRSIDALTAEVDVSAHSHAGFHLLSLTYGAAHLLRAILSAINTLLIIALLPILVPLSPIGLPNLARAAVENAVSTVLSAISVVISPFTFLARLALTCQHGYTDSAEEKDREHFWAIITP